MLRNRRTRFTILAVVAAVVAIAAVTGVVLFLLRDADTEDPVNEHIRIGDEALEHENFDRAVWAYTEFINLFPDDALGYSKRGLAHQMNGELNKAIEDYDSAIDIDPDNADLYAKRGAAYADSGLMNRGLEDLDMALDLDDANVEAYLYRGRVHFWYRGETDLAEADFTSAIGLDPDSVEAHLDRGDLRLKTLDFEGAAEDYAKVIEIDPDHPVGYAVRGEAYVGLKQFDKAVPDLNRAIQTAAESWVLYNLRGRAHYGVGDLESAVRDFDRLLELDPCTSDWDLSLQAALEAYTDLIELEPNNAEAYLNRALVRAKMGQIPRSKFDFQHAIDRDPDLGAAYYFRAYYTAYVPIKYEEALKATDSEQIKSDLARAKDLGYAVPRDNTDECRQIIAEFREHQP